MERLSLLIHEVIRNTDQKSKIYIFKLGRLEMVREENTGEVDEGDIDNVYRMECLL